MIKHIIKVNLDTGVLGAFNSTIKVSCVVRNEINKWRPRAGTPDICYSVPDKKPIMPRQFPKGTWQVGRPDARSTPYLAPFFIPTNACQYLPIWKLDDKGCYVEPMKYTVLDKGYGLHFSTSTSTEGCIKILSQTDLLWLVTQIKNYQAMGDTIELVVE